MEYETIEDARNAINTLSDSELGSRNIFVREVSHCVCELFVCVCLMEVRMCGASH